MRQKKLRVIRPAQPNRGFDKLWGINIPEDIAVLFKNTHFTITKSGTSIILTSGTKVTLTNYPKEEVADYKFEDCRV